MGGSIYRAVAVAYVAAVVVVKLVVVLIVVACGVARRRKANLSDADNNSAGSPAADRQGSQRVAPRNSPGANLWPPCVSFFFVLRQCLF